MLYLRLTGNQSVTGPKQPNENAQSFPNLNNKSVNFNRMLYIMFDEMFNGVSMARVTRPSSAPHCRIAPTH